MNANAACFNFEEPYEKIRINGLAIYEILTLNILNFCKAFFVVLESTVAYEYLYIHSCYRASLALILFFGSNANSLFTRSMASFDIVYHSSSSVRNLPSFTFYIICSSLAPLKGGYPHNKI